MEDLWPTAGMLIFSIHLCMTSASHFNSSSGQGILFGLRIFGNNWIVDGKKKKDVVLYFCSEKLKWVNIQKKKKKEKIEENNGIGKTKYLIKKIRDTKGTFQATWAQ